MRKFTSLILCGALALSIAGCSSKPANTTGATEVSESAQETTVPDNSDDEFISKYAAFTVTSESLENGKWKEITASTVAGQSLSPQLSWEPVEGATVYAIYMIDMNTHYFIHWSQGDITETNLPEGYATSRNYVGAYPPAGSTHQYNIYVIALKNPVERVKGSPNTVSAKIPEFIEFLDTDINGNTGNIVAAGKIEGLFTGK